MMDELLIFDEEIANLPQETKDLEDEVEELCKEIK